MSIRKPDLQLMLTGAGPRVLVALAVIAVVWLGFFWATTTPGAL